MRRRRTKRIKTVVKHPVREKTEQAFARIKQALADAGIELKVSFDYPGITFLQNTAHTVSLSAHFNVNDTGGAVALAILFPTHRANPLEEVVCTQAISLSYSAEYDRWMVKSTVNFERPIVPVARNLAKSLDLWGNVECDIPTERVTEVLRAFINCFVDLRQRQPHSN